MKEEKEKTADTGSHGSRKRDTVAAKGQGVDEGCRCKEVALKTPQELVKMMISDLAFWKKKR